MEPHLGYVTCCLMAALVPLVSGPSPSSSPVCARLSDSVRNEPRMRVRRREDLLNIAHGNLRTEKCNFLFHRTPSFSMGCQDIAATCSAPRLRATFASPARITALAPPLPPPCDLLAIYRTLDGSCNNLLNPMWGQAETPQRRILPNVYNDGLGAPKTLACFGGTLPSARRVSNMIHSSGPFTLFEQSLSVLLMEFGQFLAHDFVLTKVFTRPDGSPLECCGADAADPQCFPITIPLGDPIFVPGSCMNLARSSSISDLSAIRQQLNSQSAYLDLSLVYGTSIPEAAFLRTFGGGLMKNVINKLPADPADSTCFLSLPSDPIHYYCPIAGDGRVNEQPILASMHTIFMREHNRLATGLAAINPTWTDEMLYQEARKINIAQWQNIVYSEYLATILGPAIRDLYNLRISPLGFEDNYDPTVDASIINAFAVAVFRFGHSQVRNDLGEVPPVTPSQPLEQHFFEPVWYHRDFGQGLENMLNWATSVRCPFADHRVEDAVRQRLFLDSAGNSLDLVTLNVQRGRDHGVPGYTAYRTYCGLSPVTHFGTGIGGLVDHDLGTAFRLMLTYACPGDIDLFTGLLTERRSGGSLLGPTWQCLLATQFRNFRVGDRFFFERNDPLFGFTLAQLNSIKSVTLSDIICRNTHIKSLQPHAFQRPNHHGNKLRHCHHYHGVNLKFWAGMPGHKG